MKHQPRLEIQYCKQCRWLLRAAWMLQELLITFEAEIGQAALVPGTGGVFEGESMAKRSGPARSGGVFLSWRS